MTKYTLLFPKQTIDFDFYILTHSPGSLPAGASPQHIEPTICFHPKTNVKFYLFC